MFLAKEELTIKIAQIDRVEIDNDNVRKAGKDEVLEELAANSTGADEQDTRVLDAGVEGAAQRALQ